VPKVTNVHEASKKMRLNQMGQRISMAVVLTASMTAGFLSHASEQILPGLRPSEAQRLKIWGFEIYDARLWTRPEFSVLQYSTQSFGLELTYLRKFEGKEIARRSIEEMKRIGKFNAEQEAQWLKAMTEIFPTVDKGDKLLGVYKPNEGAEFWTNQKRVGLIPDPQFAKLFFGIWLHEATSAPELRQAWMNKP
jgi:hypothetical protein